MVLFCNIRELSEFMNHHCSPLCRYIFCEICMMERSKEYQINDEHKVCPTCQRVLSNVIEGVNS